MKKIYIKSFIDYGKEQGIFSFTDKWEFLNQHIKDNNQANEHRKEYLKYLYEIDPRPKNVMKLIYHFNTKYWWKNLTENELTKVSSRIEGQTE